MKFKEFCKWCNDRACDGRWGMSEALICMQIYEEIMGLRFWKREKVWQDKYVKQIYKEIIEPTNKRIDFYLQLLKDGK